MKNYTKVSAQKYLRHRDSFQSPQFSTVIQVNPSCESQQSMLEKIIFPGHLETVNINNCNPKPYKKTALTERNPNSYREVTKQPYFQEVRKDKNRNQSKNQENLPIYQSKNYISRDQNIYPSHERQQKQNRFTKNSIRDEFKHKNYNPQPYFYDSKNQNKLYSTSSSLIDEKEVQRIQQKIRSHQLRQYNKSNNEIYQGRKRSLQDTMQKQLSKIQIYDSDIKMKKKQTIIDKIKDERVSAQKQDVKLGKNKKSNEPQNKKIRFSQNAQQCLQTIYELVLIDKSQLLSPININLKKSIKEQIKLVLGPIFADVTIKGKSISKIQFIDKAFQLLNQYQERQIEEIFFSIINGLSSKNSINYESVGKFQHAKSLQLARKPGKLLKNSKTGCQNKQNPKNDQENKNHWKYFPNFQFSDDFKQKRTVNKQVPQRFSKKVYIEQFEKTQSEEDYQISKQRLPQAYSTKINLNHYTLQIMLNQQRSKRQYSTVAKKEELKTRNLSQSDDELQRLNKLEQKFSEHFKAKGSK